jgi:hypothetical protein
VSPSKATTVFGKIPFATYLHVIATGYWDTPVTVETPSNTFAALGAMFDSAGGTPWEANALTSCRSVTIRMVMSADDPSQPDNGTTVFDITQNSLNEQATPAFQDEQPFTQTFQLDGSISSWTYADNGSNPDGLFFLPGTTANCYTPTGAE